MPWRKWLRWTRSWEANLSEELQFHLEKQIAANVAAGMPPEEARREARLQLGALEGLKESCREERGGFWLESLWQDVSYGLRMLRKSPGFTTVAVLTLALGIGANTAIFSVVEAVLLRPLAFQNPNQLFAIWTSAEGESDLVGASMPEFQDYQSQNHSFDSISNVLPGWTAVLLGAGEPRTVNCTGISRDFFPMLRVQPLLGRLYTPAEYHVADVQIVISDRFWKQSLGGDPNVIGRVLNLDGAAQTVIGVVPSMPDLFPETDVWPKDVLDFAWIQIRGNRILSVIGRLKNGVSPREAEQDLTAILRRGPGEPPHDSIQLVPLKDDLTGNVRTQLEIVMAAVAVVPLIVCANISCLLLGRSAKRQVEISVRLSLGAGTRRILCQFVTENLLLAILGGALGVILASNGVKVVEYLGVGDLPRNHGIAVDLPAMAFAICVSVLTALFVAWMPFSVFSGLDLNSTLKRGRGAGSLGKSRLHALMVSEISLVVVLLVAAGLLMRSFWELEHLDPGFQPRQVLFAYLRNSDYNAGRTFFPELNERASKLPGVQAAALAKCEPGVFTPLATVSFDDRPADPYRKPGVDACWISGDFFRAIGGRLLQGRYFDARDDARSPAVVIVNQALAAAYWPGQDPIGRRIAVDFVGPGRATNHAPRFREIVGVVANIRQQNLDAPPAPAVYTPYLQDETNHVFAGLYLFIRRAGPPGAVAPAVRALVRSLRADQPIDEMQTMNESLFRTLAPREFGLTLVGSFAVLALLLAAIGIFGMIAYAVNLRTPEFGLRMALGAQRGNILGLVLREGLRVGALGVFLGTCASLVCARFMRSMLFGIAPVDPITFAGVAALILLIALAACYVPAYRAMRVDPMVALRYE